MRVDPRERRKTLRRSGIVRLYPWQSETIACPVDRSARVVRQECFPWVPSTVALLRNHEALSRLVGSAPRFLDAIERLPSIARNAATVVVTGETGTGKELIARAVHYLGPRAAHPFVPVNCGALPDTLLEDELFGHERGAFTDARDKRAGLLSQAERGTLFLDEIDSLTPRAQVALLRVLQGGTYRALGGDRERPVDVRFVAATNASLCALVRGGHFRSDLYYRLCVLAIDLPPLREREEDILPLARHFLSKYHGAEPPPHLSADAERALVAYSWPGNVRELENVIQRSTAMTAADMITEADLGLAASAGEGAPIPQDHATPGADRPDSQLPPFNEAKRAVVDAFERDYLRQALRAHRGNVSRAAQSARKERRDFGRLLKKHQLDPREF
jgi:two-component system, NtrC family, response regulator GlrR